jgi:hypothetical protein
MIQAMRLHSVVVVTIVLSALSALAADSSLKARYPFGNEGFDYSKLATDELKALDMACNRSADTGLLGAGDAAHCSYASEELKRRLGGWEDYLRWWRSTKRG